jgi:hypothetical protein
VSCATIMVTLMIAPQATINVIGVKHSESDASDATCQAYSTIKSSVLVAMSVNCEFLCPLGPVLCKVSEYALVRQIELARVLPIML